MATKKVLSIEFEESKYHELVLAANNEGMPVHDLAKKLLEDYLAIGISYKELVEDHLLVDTNNDYEKDESLDNENNIDVNIETFIRKP